LSSERFFFDVGAIWVVTMVGGPLRDKSYNHVVFKMTPDDYNDRLQRIPARGLELKEGRSRASTKSLRDKALCACVVLNMDLFRGF